MDIDVAALRWMKRIRDKYNEDGGLYPGAYILSTLHPKTRAVLPQPGSFHIHVSANKPLSSHEMRQYQTDILRQCIEDTEAIAVALYAQSWGVMTTDPIEHELLRKLSETEEGIRSDPRCQAVLTFLLERRGGTPRLWMARILRAGESHYAEPFVQTPDATRLGHVQDLFPQQRDLN